MERILVDYVYSIIKLQLNPLFMKANMGTVDKVVRILAAVGIVALYFGNVISGTVAIVLLVFAGAFIVTSMISFCPLYLPFGLSTRPKQAKQE